MAAKKKRKISKDKKKKGQKNTKKNQNVDNQTEKKVNLGFLWQPHL